MLNNEAYRGWRIWNKTRKVRKPDGKKTYRHRPRSEWIIVKEAHPALVDEVLWNAVEEMKKRKERHRPKIGRGGDRTAFSPYLLTGLVKCGECGGNYIVHAPRGEKAGKYAYYRCGYHQRRGDCVCANRTFIQKERLEGAVLDLLQQQVLTKQTVQTLIEEVQRSWKDPSSDSREELKRVERELRKVERELTNLVHAIKTAGISATLRTELERGEQRKAGLEKALQGLQQAGPQKTSLPTAREIVEALDGFRCLLESGTPQERKAVLEENIAEILVQPSGEVLLKGNPAGLLPGLPSGVCREPESNRHGILLPTDFKSDFDVFSSFGFSSI